MAEIPINAGPNDYRSLLLEPTVGYATHVSTLSLTDLTGFGQYIKDVRGKICATAQNLNEPSFDAVAGMRIMSALQIREDIAQWVILSARLDEKGVFGAFISSPRASEALPDDMAGFALALRESSSVEPSAHTISEPADFLPSGDWEAWVAGLLQFDLAVPRSSVQDPQDPEHGSPYTRAQLAQLLSTAAWASGPPVADADEDAV